MVPRFFCLPSTCAKNTVTQFPEQSCGLPTLKDTAGRRYRAELFVIQPGLRTKNDRTYIHDKSRCYRWSRREHCMNIVHYSRQRYEPAGASRSYFIEAGTAAAFYRPFSKVPSCDRPAPSRYCTCPLSPRNAVCRRQAGERGREFLRPKGTIELLSAPGPQSCVYHSTARSLPMRLFAADDIARA